VTISQPVCFFAVQIYGRLQGRPSKVMLPEEDNRRVFTLVRARWCRIWGRFGHISRGLAAGLVCGCCELAGITAKSPITRVAATKVRMESPIYFFTSFNDHNSEQQVGADLLRFVVPN